MLRSNHLDSLNDPKQNFSGNAGGSENSKQQLLGLFAKNLRNTTYFLETENNCFRTSNSTEKLIVVTSIFNYIFPGGDNDAARTILSSACVHPEDHRDRSSRPGGNLFASKVKN